MSKRDVHTKQVENGGRQQSAFPDLGLIEQRTRRTWALILLVLFLVTLGLGTAVYTQKRPLESPPASGLPIDLILLGGLFALVLLLGMDVTHKQKQARRLIQDWMHGHKQLADDKGQKDYARLLDICTASSTLVSQTEVQRLLDRICRLCLKSFDCEQVSIMLLDPQTKQLDVRAALGHADVSAVLPASQPLGDGVAGWVGEHRRPLLLGSEMNPEKFWRFKRKPDRIFAAMVVPILVRDRLLGVLNVSRRSEDAAFRQEDLRAVEVLATNAAMSLVQIEQAGELESLRNEKSA